VIFNQLKIINNLKAIWKTKTYSNFYHQTTKSKAIINFRILKKIILAHKKIKEKIKYYKIKLKRIKNRIEIKV
jgi:hypothetical protein